MATSLQEMARQIAEMQQQYEAEKERIRIESMAAIRSLLDSSTISLDDLKTLFPATVRNPNRKKPGRKPKIVTTHAA